MRTLLIAVVGLVVAGVAGVAPAEVTFDWVTVGDPGNADDDTGYGSVGNVYRISKYETTNAQYAEFLNAVAADDRYELYHTNMGNPNPGSDSHGGITRSGSPGSYTYTTIAGREDMPVNFVSYFDALRFANWLHNGQPTGAQDETSTEEGAYGDFEWLRQANAKVFLPSEDEWYKAAYYDALSASYFDYPVGSDTQTTCAAPGPTLNTANCDLAVGDLADVGSYAGSPSPYGTFDQGGNVWERTEGTWGYMLPDTSAVWGGNFLEILRSALQNMSYDGLHYHWSGTGFRVASIPEPKPQLPTLSPWSQLALMVGLLGVGLGVWRGRGARP